jgi:hypothetical protein
MLVGDAQPLYAAAPVSALERRRELKDEPSRLFVLALGDRQPVDTPRCGPDGASAAHAPTTLVAREREGGHGEGRGPSLGRGGDHVDAFYAQALAIAPTGAPGHTLRVRAAAFLRTLCRGVTRGHLS